MTKQLTYRHQEDRRRAERYRAEVVELKRQMRNHPAELKAAYEKGSAETVAMFFAAISHHLRLFGYITAAMDERPSPLPPKAQKLVRELVEMAGKLALETTPDDIVKGTTS